MKKRKQFSRKTKSSVWQKTGGRCWYCGYPNNPFNRNEFCIDHVVPFSKGGTDDLSNLVPCCTTCNSEKKAKSIAEYRDMKKQRFINDYIVPEQTTYAYEYLFWYEETYTIGRDC